MAFLEIVDLEKSFGNVRVLKGINLEVEEGDFLVLVGPSGCGKSTLLNTIAGLEPISGGEIRINGRVVNDLAPAKRDIAMVFQSYALYPNMTVAGNIAFGMEMRGIPKAERDRKVAEVAKMLQIDHLLDRRPSRLSGGQRQRVAMGRALVRDPQVFLFDEPLSNLDAKLRVEMRTEIKRLHSSMGTTIVYVTHDQVEAMTLATKIAVLKDGVLQQFGTPDEVYNDPANIFVADFMGSPAMNLIPARVDAGAAEPMLVLDRGSEEPLRLPLNGAAPKLANAVGGDIFFGIRPEALTDPDSADRTASHVAHGECTIEVVEPTGSDTFAITRLGGKPVVARLRADARVRAGEPMRLAFNLDKTVFFDAKTEQRIA
ncbi:ABC transporter ATP-binding protein [Consotaella salsifontis]|uniref:Carbohydrate ABC transporter ATP-binding protein, CUT1 family n=1 Tax=Consotaella salsifontis TaxID=1365950 RepID=A0A1T4MP70_9HYPH|nr:ABC transporter ATP-binding protein [Consotaella salsifontis]SJZ68829.1 carbohydrate ABC transporter ATP-binding protein, CUT1 family [Consotaella salsifontis]